MHAFTECIVYEKFKVHLGLNFLRNEYYRYDLQEVYLAEYVQKQKEIIGKEKTAT